VIAWGAILSGRAQFRREKGAENAPQTGQNGATEENRQGGVNRALRLFVKTSGQGL